MISRDAIKDYHYPRSIRPQFLAHPIEIAIVWPNSAWTRSSVGELLSRLRNLAFSQLAWPLFSPLFLPENWPWRFSDWPCASRVTRLLIPADYRLVQRAMITTPLGFLFNTLRGTTSP